MHIPAHGVHIGHGESPQAADAHQLPPLLAPEAVSGHLYHLQGQGLVGYGHVMAHQELAETGGETEEKLSLVRVDLILPGGKAVQILFQSGMLHIVHDGGLHLHGAHVRRLLQYQGLQEGLDQPAFGVVAHVARVGARLVVHQLQPSHQLHMGRDLVHCSRFGDLVVGELLQVSVPLEIELVCVHQLSIQI